MHSNRIAVEAETDREARSLFDLIVQQLSLMTTAPDELAIEMNGHHCLIRITETGRRRLEQQLYPHIHGKLSAQRSAGEIAILQERIIMEKIA